MLSTEPSQQLGIIVDDLNHLASICQELCSLVELLKLKEEVRMDDYRKRVLLDLGKLVDAESSELTEAIGEYYRRGEYPYMAATEIRRALLSHGGQSAEAGK